ncbi:MAG TPA: LysR substrate-binding domain-containing protein [Steroidobacteraceae bacterium]|nr:LysR substrate-binding domain-containing protein [Steroidobacteraceae bacterium]
MADLKLKDLRYLAAVADTRHFGQAAARCFVSQPTLSAQIKKLEEYLGVQLLERHPRRIALTEAGTQVVARARRIIEASDEIVTLAENRRDPLAGRLRMALLPTIGPYLLPLVATRIRRKLPRLELLLYEYQTGPMLDHLHAGDIDVGILALPVPADGLVERRLFDEPFVVALPEQHSLAKRRSVKPADLNGETLLLLEDGHCLREQALDVCSHTNAQEKQDFRATSLETLRQMVASGGGVTLLPLLASSGAYGNARGVATVPFAPPAPARHIGALWRRTTARSASIKAVCDVIAEAALKQVGS